MSKEEEEEEEAENLPAPIAGALAGVPKALIPASLKALDRLIGAAVDIPAAWLKQKKAKIDAQSAAYTAVEAAIGKSVADNVSRDPAIIERAKEVLVRSAYKKQLNREAVGLAAIEDLRTTGADEATESCESESTSADPRPEIDEDWFNAFERYAEDASTERMQQLWGRVLGGEIRKPGRFSLRTLRFLSEFSKREAEIFGDLAKKAFGDVIPKTLAKPEDVKDIRHLIALESAGLIQGAAAGLGLTMNFTEKGFATLVEGNLVIVLKGEPGTSVRVDVMSLTPIGQELLSLVPDRDPREAASRVAHAIRTPAIKSASISAIVNDQLLSLEVFWDDSATS